MLTNPPDPILTRLLETVPHCWRVNRIYLGTTWAASFIENEAGEHRIGLAALHGVNQEESGFLQPGFNRLHLTEAHVFSRHALSVETLKTSAGLATLNALL